MPLWYGIRVVVNILKRLGIAFLVLASLWALYSGYRWLWITTGWTRPFVVDDLTMPPLHKVVERLWQPAATEQPILLQLLLEKALFTAKEAFFGFAHRERSSASRSASSSTSSNLLRRGLLPFVVGSQTIPILAIAPMVVIWLGGKGLPVWVPGLRHLAPS